MKRYVKRCMGLALVLVCLISATQVSAFANEITPRYVGISLIAADLDISTSGRASCYGYVAVESGYSVDLTVSLQRDGRTIRSWSDSGDEDIEITGTYYVTPGHDYQVVVSAVVENSRGSVVDRPTMESSVVEY